MSADLYLIAHKVRGEPAFDIATRLACPHCDDQSDAAPGCHECDQLGYWWIVPTSGHRAYPWWEHKLEDMYCHPDNGLLTAREMVGTDECPPNWPDHYPTPRSAPTISLTEALGIRPMPLPPIKRRF